MAASEENTKPTKIRKQTKEFLFFSLVLLVSYSLFDIAVASAQKRPAASPKAASQFNRLAQEASAAREADRLEEAIPLYLQALRLKPSWKEGWWYVGTMYYERDEFVEARDAFKKFVSLEEKFGPAWSMMGMCEFRLKEYPQALLSVRRGNRLGFGDNQEIRRAARYHEAILLTRFEHYELSYDLLSRMLKEQSDSQDLISALGLALLRLPYLPSETPPEKREVVYKTGRASFLAVTNHTSEAEREFRELIANFPNTPGTHYAYGVFLLRDRSDDGLEEFRRELLVSPDHVPARLQIAFEYIKRGEHAKGLPFAEEALKLAPGLFAAHNALGRILLETGEVERAIRELEAGVKLAPDSPEMQFALARAYTRAGRKDDAEKARAEFRRLDEIKQKKEIGTNEK